MKRPKTYDEELAELEMIAKTVTKSKGGRVRGGREGGRGWSEEGGRGKGGREGGREGGDGVRKEEQEGSEH